MNESVAKGILLEDGSVAKYDFESLANVPKVLKEIPVARVGQYLEVEEVDSEGKITKVRAIDRGTPDWNQNDSTSKDYIENRPFYSEDYWKVVNEFEDYNYGINDTVSLHVMDAVLDMDYEVGTLFRVIFDGTEYICPLRVLSDGLTRYLGNYSLVSKSYPDTSEVFVLYSNGIDYMNFRNTAPHSETLSMLSISVIDEKIHKLDEKYLPDTVLKTKDKEELKKSISSTEAKIIGKAGTGQNSETFNDTRNVASGNWSHAEGLTTSAKGAASHAEGESGIAYSTGSHAEGMKTKAGGKSDTDTGGAYAHAEGVNSVAYGRGSHAEGENTLAQNQYSHAEGGACQALGDYSHAEGCNSGNISTTAFGKASHAEGMGTWARGNGSHAEGKYTSTSKDFAHAEGEDTVASGIASHVEGKGTIASGDYQHIQGKYNVDDSNKRYAHIVGGGSSDSDRKNIHTVDWDGNAWFAGSVEGTELILKSPNGSRYRITVNNAGNLSATLYTTLV